MLNVIQKEVTHISRYITWVTVIVPNKSKLAATEDIKIQSFNHSQLNVCHLSDCDESKQSEVSNACNS
jgi:hypothetical protein